jgi:uncharacterized protein (TIRG00374 family)
VAYRSRRHWLTFLAGALVLGLLLGYSVRRNPQWREFQWTAFLATFLQIEPGWAAAGLLAVYATYVVRALRWKALMRYMEREPNLWNLFSATVIGFAAIGVFGRAGEMVRPYLVSRKENVPLSGQVAVWLVERCFDTLILLVTAAFALSRFQAAALRDSPAFTGVLHMAGNLVAFSTLALVVLMIALRSLSELINNWIIRRLPRRLHGVERHLRAFEEGTRGLHNPRTLSACILYSLLEWLLIAICYAAVFNSFSAGLRLTPSQTLVFMACVMLGSVVNIPGVGGGLQVASVLVLTELFGVRPEPAAGISLLIWFLTFLAVVPPAVLLMLYEGLSWSKLRRLESEN